MTSSHLFHPFGLTCRAGVSHDGGMTLDQQIEVARAALQDLSSDEAELTRLEAEKVGELAALRAAGSRDFTGLAELEGKRTALASMLVEQRGHVAQAAAQLGSLEVQRARATALVTLREQVDALAARRAEVDLLLLELHTFLVSHLDRVTAARTLWGEELAAAQGYAAEVFGLLPPTQVRTGQDVHAQAQQQGWAEAFAEIGEGACAALVSSPLSHSMPGLLEPYSSPIMAEYPEPLNLVGLVNFPLRRFLDRPVMLTLAAALATADQRAPHGFRGGER